MSAMDARRALRASLEHYFEVLSSGVTKATQVQPVLAELTRVSRSILGEIVEGWHQKNDRMRRLPNEIIAQCFAGLPFRDKVTVSHISRGWRSIALSYPAIWADIDLGDRYNDPIRLLEMALDRAGHHPVIVRNCPEPTRPNSVRNILSAHMFHIQHLELPRRVFPAALVNPAPQVQFLRVQTDCQIRRDLFGGRVGQLKTLHLRGVGLPDTCPALSTVTDLTLHGPSRMDHAPAFKRLFRLFPVLQSLSLRELESAFARYLPDGPPPASLRSIALETLQENYDVSEHYANWYPESPGQLSLVDIHQYTGPTQHLRPMISGAVELIIGREYTFEWTSVVSVDAAGHRRAFNFQDTSDDTHLAAEKLLDLRSALADVRSMDVAATSLAAFLPVLAALPALAHLTVTIKVEDFLLDRHDFRWSALAALAQVPDHRPELQTISISVVCDKGECPPAAEDAQALLARLERIAHVRVPDIKVKGFSDNDLRGVHVPRFHGFQVVFEGNAGPASRGSNIDSESE